MGDATRRRMLGALLAACLAGSANAQASGLAYPALRAAAPAHVAREYGKVTGAYTGSFDVATCVLVPPQAGAMDRTTRALAGLAIEQALLRRDLKSFGWPPALVDATIDAYEQRMLAEIRRNPRDLRQAEAHRQLADALNRERAARRLRTLPITAEGGCGLGETPTLFDLQPNGRMHIIPQFFFAACRAARRDPYDRRNCEGWGETFEGRDLWLGGDYVYVAQWPGGRARRGTIRIEGGEVDGGPPIVIRPES